MNLLSPLNLLWLVPVSGTILVLWMLRLKRREAVVSSLYLWQSVLRDTQANTPFQKLRRHLLLFLQILAAFLLVLALARPYVFGRGLASRVLVVILDTSPSMNATDIHPTRLDAARRAAEDYLDREMQPSDVALVISAGARPEIRCSFTTDRARLAESIEKTPASDTPPDMAASLTLALALIADRPGAQIRVFTDGVLSDRDESKVAAMDFGPADVRQVLVGSPNAGNMAITALSARRDPLTCQVQVFVDVRDCGAAAPPQGTLSLLLNDKLVDARALSLTGGVQSEIFDSPLFAGGGLVTARLDITDDLSLDNEDNIVLPPPSKRRVLLVSAGNLFLERGLNLDPAVVVEECAPADFSSAGHSGAGYDLVVWDGPLPPSQLPPANYLIFHGGETQGPLIKGGPPVQSPVWLDNTANDPVMRYVDLSGLVIRQADRTALASDAHALADASSGPLIAADEVGGHRRIAVAFALADSNWPLRVSFPIFLANAEEWLTAGDTIGPIAQETPPGEPAQIVVPPGQDHVTIDGPGVDGFYLTAPRSGGIVSFPNTDRVGIYHLHDVALDLPFAVDLLDSEASRVVPVALSALNHPARQSPLENIPRSRRAKNELWVYVAAFALVLLIGEWFAYHRRL